VASPVTVLSGRTSDTSTGALPPCAKRSSFRRHPEAPAVHETELFAGARSAPVPLPRSSRSSTPRLRCCSWSGATASCVDSGTPFCGKAASGVHGGSFKSRLGGCVWRAPSACSMKSTAIVADRTTNHGQARLCRPARAWRCDCPLLQSSPWPATTTSPASRRGSSNRRRDCPRWSARAHRRGSITVICALRNDR
jgi:hypothetical protein